MTTLVLALTLVASATCDSPGVSSLEENQQEPACELLARPAPAGSVDFGPLAAIYERPEFDRARQRNSGAFQAFLAQLRAWFERLFESTGAQTYSNVTRILVLAVAIAIGVTLIARVLRRKSALTASAPAPVSRSLDLEDPAVHLARARSALETEPREAMREGWLAVLSSLERRRYARPDRVKTNVELVSELPKAGAPAPLTERVGKLVTWFDHSFYSLAMIERAEAQTFLEQVAAIAEGGPS